MILMFDCDLYGYTRLLIVRDKAKPGSDLQITGLNLDWMIYSWKWHLEIENQCT